MPTSPAAMPFHPSMVTTGLELSGFRIVRNFGVVRGIVVRSRSIIGNIGAGLQTLVGGNITIYTDLCEKTRKRCLRHDDAARGRARRQRRHRRPLRLQ